MRVWVTRAEPGASATAARLTALGHLALVSPVLAVRTLAPPIDLAGVDALAFTSANGVRAFAGLTPRRDLPVFAVGEATGQAAAGAGFPRVSDAAGDVVALGALILQERPGVLLHPTAREAADLVGRLRSGGVEAHALAVYETAAAAPTSALAALDTLDAVLVHSPKAARVVDASLAPEVGARLRLVAISPAAAQPLGHRAWLGVEIASSPTEADLLAALVRA